ncbi:aminotransferase class III-fold pyridoxal phosphate-dependent enzyme, partial [Candidatus Bathyarchaeota archaeon]|nr:aminotransferase class III-fold pyridoxal phosphate-dependent enzyme [Candidatus Bathyarchaeota archaeon]
MTGLGYSIEPRDVPPVDTPYRKICTQIPVPESLPLLRRLRGVEARSLHWQAPIFWDHADGISIFDKYGNKWLDMSCGIVVTNIGHSRGKVVEAICQQAKHGLLYNFTFP